MEKKFTIDGVEHVISKLCVAGEEVTFDFIGTSYRFKLLQSSSGVSWVVQDCNTHAVHRGAIAPVPQKLSTVVISTDGTACEVAPVARKGGGQEVSAVTGSNPVAPLTGVIREVSVAVGQEVTANQTVATMEAMKMQLAIVAPKAGTVREVCVGVGDQVMEGQIVVVVG
jgi:biotin carboxyl carrier protein